MICNYIYNMLSIYEIHILADAYSDWVIYRKTIKTDHHDFDSNWNRMYGIWDYGICGNFMSCWSH